MLLLVLLLFTKHPPQTPAITGSRTRSAQWNGTGAALVPRLVPSVARAKPACNWSRARSLYGLAERQQRAVMISGAWFAASSAAGRSGEARRRYQVRIPAGRRAIRGTRIRMSGAQLVGIAHTHTHTSTRIVPASPNTSEPGQPEPRRFGSLGRIRWLRWLCGAHDQISPWLDASPQPAARLHQPDHWLPLNAALTD